VSQASGAAPVVETTAGRVQGYEDEGIAVFKGIPYGSARRFEAAVAPAPWTGIRAAVEYGPRCPQIIRPGTLLPSTDTTPTAEDCLVLNVWTPAGADGRSASSRAESGPGGRPVMVWYHGGGFGSLSGSSRLYDGVRLCQRGDVVVVTVNHRINVFGYLQVDGCPDAANAGMLDLILALQWVRDNIERFGGDPGNVTVFGESGGGAKVCVLMGMPAASGLYHRAIVQSGVHLTSMNQEQAAANAARLLAELGEADVRTAPADAVVAAYERVLANGSVGYSPVVDGRHLPRQPWQPDAPEPSAAVPLLFCSTRTETTLLAGAYDRSLFDLAEGDLAHRLRRWLPADRIEEVAAAFADLYPDTSPSERFFLLTSDLYSRLGGWALADRKAAQGTAAVWHAELVWDTPFDDGRWMCPHTLDIPLVFANVGRVPSVAGTGDEAVRVSAQMSAAWLAFARTGDPNDAAIPDWPAWSVDRPVTMLFDIESRAVADWRAGERLALAEVPFRTPDR
jgi:para-nitrobenzyl esterase